MRAKDILLRSAIIVLGALATLAFVITKVPSALAWATSRSYEYGDLYRFAKITDFKPAQPLPRGEFADGEDSIDAGRPLPNQNDNILLGDSFSFCDWGEGPFRLQLQRKLGLPLFSIYRNHHPSPWENPCPFLNSPSLRSSARRVVFYEAVERSLQRRFDPAPGMSKQRQPAESGSTVLSRIKKSVLEDTEARHETLLEDSGLTFPIISVWNTFLFRAFRRITPEAPVFSSNPPFLFYKDEVQCFEAVHSDEQVSRIADNIASLGKDLQSKLNYTLVFMPAPNKITLYSNLAREKPYDDFLPRLCAALEKRGINTVELLPALRQQSQLLYWPTDTHWNDAAIQIAVEKAAEHWPRRTKR